VNLSTWNIIFILESRSASILFVDCAFASDFVETIVDGAKVLPWFGVKSDSQKH
jgi:hypothetical protein